ncbi:fibronectin type III domain-containing protein [Saccharothrix sp. BKS2]|uniref:fibronectin type III domain-containing protein n=1 Tax=Saccharothrix sp. BKS2 TaxID=3064400 RepID=UPI0039EBA507
MRRLLVVPVLLLAACGRERPEEQPARPTPELVAELTSAVDVALRWRPEPGAAGQVVEYANEPGGAYTALEFAPPHRNSYEHLDLIPRTSFHYRVRSFHGPASEPAGVTLPPGDEVPESDGHGWAEPVRGPSGTRPVRSADAAPADFRAEVRHANGILFTWTDRAAGEEGYLVEVRPAGAADFTVAAQLDPDVRSFGLITLPEEKTATYRVRPYYYGTTTNTAHQRTGGP